MRHSLIEELRAGQLLLPDFLAQVEAHFNEREPSIQAFVPEENRFARLHREADRLLLQHQDLINRPLLFGALIGVKDIFHTEGFSTQAGSRLPAEALQGTESSAVTRLKEAGALIFGKTVTTEFAFFSPGPTRNPHHPEHTPGGSSSGSAAAVAAGFCHLALGTQTIGSIIRPASFCGVVGVKPTYDRVSREGVIPLAPSLDHVGFFAADVDTAIDAARVLYQDWEEPTLPLKPPRLAIPEGPYLQRAAPESLDHFEAIVNTLTTAGYEIQRIPLLSDFNEVLARNAVILGAEAARVHADWFQQYGSLYSQQLTDLIRRGQQITDAQLQDALSARDSYRAELRKTFLDHNIDLWICPSTTAAAPKGLESTGDPIMNLPWTQAGLPVLTLPAGTSQDKLPLGLQVIANWYKDESLLFWSKDIEKALQAL